MDRATIAFQTAFQPCFGYTWNLMPLAERVILELQRVVPERPRASLFSPGFVYAWWNRSAHTIDVSSSSPGMFHIFHV